MTSAADALTRLKEGNARFLQGGSSAVTAKRPGGDNAKSQSPFAIILGCSDSRVPPEIIFDQGLGDLFVIRVAGQVATPSQIGSIEFAAEKFGTRLVVVLGHSRCGAVAATIDQLRQPAAELSPNLLALVGKIKPAVESLLDQDAAIDDDELIAQAVTSNVKAIVATLRQDSQSLGELIENDGLEIVGAEYCLDTGKVEFLQA